MTPQPTPQPTPSTVRIEIAPRTILLVLGATAAIWLLGQLTAVLMVVVVALILVGTFDPLVAWLEQRGFRRGRALVLVFVLAALSMVGVVLLMVPPLASQVIDLIAQAPVERTKLIAWLAKYQWAKPMIKTINDLPIDDIGTKAGGIVFGYTMQLLEMVGYGLSTLFLAIYLLADPARSKGLLYAVIPRHNHVKLATILLELKVIVGGYMRGQLITSLSIALFVFVILTALGADNALAIALFAGLTDIIPFVGGYIATAPVVIAVTPSGLATTLIVLLVMFVYQEFESRILVPRVYGRTLRLPPAIVLIALLVGGTLAGILGALLALPLAAGLQMIIRELRVDLPGEQGQHDAEKVIDDRANEVYEQLTEGVSAAAAGLVAEELAVAVKKNEDTLVAAETPAGTPT
ncbi:AI-2E family transporter [soil metagenome]